MDHLSNICNAAVNEFNQVKAENSRLQQQVRSLQLRNEWLTATTNSFNTVGANPYVATDTIRKQQNEIQVLTERVRAYENQLALKAAREVAPQEPERVPNPLHRVFTVQIWYHCFGGLDTKDEDIYLARYSTEDGRMKVRDLKEVFATKLLGSSDEWRDITARGSQMILKDLDNFKNVRTIKGDTVAYKRSR